MIFKKGNNLLLFFREITVVTKGVERQEHGEHLRAYYGCPHVKSLMRAGRGIGRKTMIKYAIYISNQKNSIFSFNMCVVCYYYLGTENKGKEYKNWLKILEVIVNCEQNKFCPFKWEYASCNN